MTEDLRRGSWLGRHELLLRIGRGGMATVWVAREHTEKVEDQRLLAVKAILADLAGDPEFVKMFLDEGRLVQSIRHPNVVDVYEVGEHDGVMYMSMEWVEGDSLHSVIAEAGKRRPIPAEMAVRIIADAAAGLHAAHEAKGEDGQLLGVVHRDVSPHNILLGTDGAIKLVDFGVAKAMGRLSEATSAGQLKGKFGYMSPEQAMAKPIDRRSDVFSLGIVLFELTTGRRLFRGEHDAETLHLVVSGQIPNPSKINDKYPKKLEQIVLKALERDVRATLPDGRGVPEGPGGVPQGGTHPRTSQRHCSPAQARDGDAHRAAPQGSAGCTEGGVERCAERRAAALERSGIRGRRSHQRDRRQRGQRRGQR